MGLRGDEPAHLMSFGQWSSWRRGKDSVMLSEGFHKLYRLYKKLYSDQHKLEKRTATQTRSQAT